MDTETLRINRPPGSTRWGQRKRLEFLESRLLWEGRINRSELVEFFGISVPQASQDLAKYGALAPGNLVYDPREKVYRCGNGFNPRLIAADATTYLGQLRGVVTGSRSRKSSFIGWLPPAEVVAVPERIISADVLRRVVSAMRERMAIYVGYQSMRRPRSTQRWIEPHAMAYDGARWHVRGWCHETKIFRDFVISRIASVGEERPASVDSREDVSWSTFVDMILVPKPGLSEPQRLAVEAEYGMQTGRLLVRTRVALLHYAVRHLQLDRDVADPSRPQIYWQNEQELAHHLLPNNP
jgi:WYL domain